MSARSWRPISSSCQPSRTGCCSCSSSSRTTGDGSSTSPSPRIPRPHGRPNAFPEDRAPRYLLHDRDTAFTDIMSTIGAMQKSKRNKSCRLHVSGLILRRASRALVGVGLTKVCGGAEPPRRNNNSHGKSRQPIVAALLREAGGALGRTAPRRTTPEPAFPSCPARRSTPTEFILQT